MESPLTVLTVVKNNKNTIEKLLSSIEEINYNLLVGNIGSSDGTIDILLRNKAKIIQFAFDNDFSKIKNQLIEQVKNGWIIFLDPHEHLISGIEELKRAIAGPVNCYSFPVIQGDSLTKSVKLWHKSCNIKFTNPVYETIDCNSQMLNCYIGAQTIPQQFDIVSIIKKWQQTNPLSSDPIYYMACYELFNKNWDSFINYAELYIHQQKKQTISYYMINYYLSLILCYVKNDYKNAINHLSICIIKNPTMAEFWCLLGDVFYKIKQYEKAFQFYQNAKILGQRRLWDSEWPMEISKYSAYPDKMIESTKALIESTTIYVNK